jgi:hypothetical protein
MGQAAGIIQVGSGGGSLGRLNLLFFATCDCKIGEFPRQLRAL